MSCESAASPIGAGFYSYVTLSAHHLCGNNMYAMEALVGSHPVFLTDIYLPCPDLLRQGG